MKKRYTVILEKDEQQGGYHVSCPGLPGCHSEGDTVEEALANIGEAIEVYIESLVAHGDPVPEAPEIVVAHAEVVHAEAAALPG